MDNRSNAVSVGVGFNHRDVFDPLWQGGADVLQIAFQRAEIDFGPGAKLIGNRHKRHQLRPLA